MEAAFQQLKRQLASDVVLASPNFPFIHITDRCLQCWLAGVLSQADHSGEDRLIAYFSRKHLPRESNAIQQWNWNASPLLAVYGTSRMYLKGVEFTV